VKKKKKKRAAAPEREVHHAEASEQQRDPEVLSMLDYGGLLSSVPVILSTRPRVVV